MEVINLKEVGQTGLLISRDGLTVYYESLGEWYEFPTEAPSDYNYRYFRLPHRVWVDGHKVWGVHQAVAMAWEPESFVGKDKPNVHHCDFDRFNNDISNLIVLDSSAHSTLHCLIGDKPVSKAEAEDLLRSFESIPWEEAFHKYRTGELKTRLEAIDFIKERTGISVTGMTVWRKFKELNGGLNPSGRKTHEFISLSNPALIEAFHKYQAGELKNRLEAIDFIKERTGISVTGMTVSRKFKELNGGLNPSGRKTREFIALDDPALIKAFEKYQAGELKNQFAVIDFIKERTGVEIRQSVVSWKFKQLNGGLNPSGRKISKTYKTREFIPLNNPALIEAFHKYQAGELKNRLEAIDFIKERTGISVTGMTVSRKFKQLRESL